MQLIYSVDQDNLREMIECSLCQRYHKPLGLALTLVLSLGQLAFCIILCLSGRLAVWPSVLLLCLSAGICVLNYLFRINMRFRSRLAHRSYQNGGGGNMDFWKPHRLEIGDDSLRLSYGITNRKFANTEQLAITLLPNSVMLLCESELVDVIPRSVFKDPQSEQAFLDMIHQFVYNGLVSAVRQQRKQLPVAPRYHFTYSYDMPTYLRHQRQAQRSSLLMRVGWPARDSLRFCITLLCAYYVLTREVAIWMTVAGILGFFLLNMQLYISFTPWLDHRVKKTLSPLLPYITRSEAEIYADDQAVHVLGELYYQQVSIDNIVAVKKLGDMCAMYLKSGTFLTVCRPQKAEAAEFDRFCDYMAYRTSKQQTRRG